MPDPVSNIVNRALDMAGSSETIGDIEEGTAPARAALRHYMPQLKQLSRAAHWNCLRKQAPLVMLADATGQTANVGTVVPVPWTYEYQLPTDCMKVRFVPQNTNNPAPVTPPLMTNLNQPPANLTRVIPSRFLVATDFNYPIAPQPVSQDKQPWMNDVQGVSPTDRTVVLSNVNQAIVVYTALFVYPTLWDALFEEAFAATLAAAISMPLAADKKFGLQMRAQNLAIAKAKVDEARVRDGDEGFFNTDTTASWIKARGRGASWWNWGPQADPGPGIWFNGWDAWGGDTAY